MGSCWVWRDVELGGRRQENIRNRHNILDACAGFPGSVERYPLVGRNETRGLVGFDYAKDLRAADKAEEHWGTSRLQLGPSVRAYVQPLRHLALPSCCIRHPCGYTARRRLPGLRSGALVGLNGLLVAALLAQPVARQVSQRARRLTVLSDSFTVIGRELAGLYPTCTGIRVWIEEGL